MSAMTHFDRTTAVDRRGADPQGPAVYDTRLDETWASLLGVHGGYVTALAVRAAQAFVPDRPVRTVSISFLRRTEVGPAEIEVEIARSGRSFTTLLTRTRQQGRDVATARITMLGPVTAPTWTSVSADRPPPLEDCVPFTPPAFITHFANAELRLDPATIPTGDADSSRIAGYVRPPDVRALDAAWLVVLGDWFPPSPFRRVAPPTGGISIDYVVHVHQPAPPEEVTWVAGVMTSENNVGGIALERGLLSTPAGAPLAETFHTRWTGQ